MRAVKNTLQLFLPLFLSIAMLVTPVRAQVAEQDRLKAFLNVTGFDVALESLQLSADSAPDMLGIDPQTFGFQWTQLVKEVFDTDLMHDMALNILSETLSEDLLTHSVDFYTSDLGQRLVTVENASHLFEDDDLKGESGEAIVAGLVRLGSPRLELLKRMNAASDSAGNAIRAIQEVQVRFLMAAASAGVIELTMDEPDLRILLNSNEAELRLSIQTSALSGAAYTYQAFSDEEVEAYTQALENPKMRDVYDLMNAVQFEIMANRFEALAGRMRSLQPSEEL